MTLSFDNIDSANRAHAAKLGTRRVSLWERYGHRIATIVLACLAFLGVMAWLWVVTS